MTPQAVTTWVDRGLRTTLDAVVRHARRWVPAAYAAAAAAAIYGMSRLDPLLVVIAALLAVVAPVVCRSAARTLSLMIVLLMATQLERLRFEFVPLAYHPLMAYGLIGVAAFHVLKDALDRGRLSGGARSLPWAWGLVTAWMFVSVLRGVWLGHEPGALRTEAMLLALYVTYPIAADALRTPGDLLWVLVAMFAGVGLVFVEYVLAAVGGITWDVTFGRIVTRQANLVVAIAPFLLAAFLVARRGSAWWWLIGFVPCVLVTLLSQQRALFVALPVSIIAAGVVALRAVHVRRSRLVGGVLTLILSGVVGWGLLGTIGGGRGAADVSQGVAERAAEATDAAGSAAIVIRLVSFAYVWKEKVAVHPFVGWGIGDEEDIPILRGQNTTVLRVDNSYLTLWWKSGIIGLLLFTGFLVLVLWRCWVLARHPHRDVQLLAMSVAGTMVGVLVLSLASSIVTHYRFNAIWGVMMGAVAAAERIYGPVSAPSIAAESPTSSNV